MPIAHSAEINRAEHAFRLNYRIRISKEAPLRIPSLEYWSNFVLRRIRGGISWKRAEVLNAGDSSPANKSNHSTTRQWSKNIETNLSLGEVGEVANWYFVFLIFATLLLSYIQQFDLVLLDLLQRRPA